MNFQYKSDRITINTADDVCIEFEAYCPDDYVVQEIETVLIEGVELPAAAWDGVYVANPLDEDFWPIWKLARKALDWYQEYLDECRAEDEQEERWQAELSSPEAMGRV